MSLLQTAPQDRSFLQATRPHTGHIQDPPEMLAKVSYMLLQFFRHPELNSERSHPTHGSPGVSVKVTGPSPLH